MIGETYSICYTHLWEGCYLQKLIVFAFIMIYFPLLLLPSSSPPRRFIQKQGLDRTFVECDNHMWRVDNRPLPTDITVDGGSDWIAVNRNYSHYIVTDEGPFLTGLKKYYEFSLLPAEVRWRNNVKSPLCHIYVCFSMGAIH